MAVRDIRELATRQGLEARQGQKSDLTAAQNAEMIGCGDNWIKGRGGRRVREATGCGGFAMGRPQGTAYRQRLKI